MNHTIETPRISVVIPTFNGAQRIGNCLAALQPQAERHDCEIVVVNDGSSDNTAKVVATYPGVRLIHQANAGPAAARNRGAAASRGEIVLFTDDDCVPAPDWLEAMLKPFENPEIVGVKGVYRTRQKKLMARFVQIEYEDRYRRMLRFDHIDFIDTYSAAFRRDRFLAIGGYDTAFPLASAEDAELSYRMSERGWKMKFAPEAIVCHTHPDTLIQYLRKKYKFACWRMLAVRRNPSKGVRDSHTPQLMKLQLLLLPALLLSMGIDWTLRPTVPLTGLVLGAFLVSTLPFSLRALRKDPLVGVAAPFLLAARACAQLLGVIAGVIQIRHISSRVPSKSAA